MARSARSARAAAAAPVAPAPEEEKKEDDAASASAQRPNAKPSAVASAAPEPAAPSAAASSDPSDSGAPHRSSGPTPPRLRRLAALVGVALQVLLLEVPLVLVFAGYRGTILAEQLYRDYLAPQMALQTTTEDRKARELTYYHRTCTAADVTARDAPDLVIDYGAMTPADATRHMLRHGASVYPNLLSEDTAAAVRDFILRQNERNEDMIFVIENKNRWSFGVRVDQDPSIPRALTEILSNRFLVDSLERIIGPDPAIIEFTGITSAYGAKRQRYHADVVPEGNGAKWARTFVPSYSLFIPLQNITGAMGATELCPGSHMCADGVFEYCPDHGFQVSGSTDNWPLGWGALVNQQTMHRGAAHTDPAGPHRVLFILTFAPRPRTGRFQLETRSIAQGGSYSLHWKHWGHTLRDFAAAPRRMAMPGRFLRSLGLWKAAGARWGWDYITQASARIANSETGFSYNDLLEMLQNNQFSMIPKMWHGDVPEEADYSHEVWVPFYLSTLHKTRAGLRWIYSAALTVYAVLAVAGAITFSRTRGRLLASKLGRVLFAHAMVFLLYKQVASRIKDSTYTKNLRSGRLFRWPSARPFGAPDLPGTLPTENDIMVFDDMQSEYMASYTEVLDVFHPGNREWFSMMQHHSANYGKLTPQHQMELCSSLITWSQQQGRRILVKNVHNQWAEACRDLAIRFCHKEMMKETDPHLRMAIQQLDFLFSETKFGYWRDTVMHRRVIPAYLRKLQDKIMKLPDVNPSSSPSPRLLASRTCHVYCRKPITSHGSSGLARKHQKSLGRVFAVGDEVEAAYASLQTEWYRARIAGVSAHGMTWDVVYQDGELESSLCSTCVRPFVPYQVGEDNMECRHTGETAYTPCRIISRHADGTYTVSSRNRSFDFDARDLRRVVYLSDGAFQVGDYVMAPYDGADFYPAEIMTNNGDGTYDVRFLYGDEVLSGVYGRLMVLASENDLADDDVDEEAEDGDEDPY